jgi:hypothetical protein
MVILPIEIVNKILITREPHFLASIIKNFNKLLELPLLKIYDFECGEIVNGKRKRKMPIVLLTYCFRKFLFS